ncbi:hypothetical protein IMSAGC001_00649 [Bacteroides acidifaciens]|jgi:hypothetical protein|uniref:Uncharacterized protein n=1 Tax=Bacteroides acidifaciens TaxID=85831 RepID=A0A7I9ZZT7_9BACE|nr:hypothetical protein IMSAGC001_00649 [Bacteroides acidifaciens]
MRNYDNKTREEPLKKMKQLDKKNEHLSSDSPCLKQKKELDATSIICRDYRKDKRWIAFTI